MFLLLAYFLRDLSATGEKIYARDRPKVHMRESEML